MRDIVLPPYCRGEQTIKFNHKPILAWYTQSYEMTSHEHSGQEWRNVEDTGQRDRKRGWMVRSRDPPARAPRRAVAARRPRRWLGLRALYPGG